MGNETDTRPDSLIFGDEELVISGISGKFPGCDNVQEFSEKLYAGEDMVTSNEKRVPLDFFNLPKRMGTLNDISKFDAVYFGIHGKQAHAIDPQIRILLELSYEAILDAGLNPVELRGSNTAVIIGESGSESQQMWDNCVEISKDEYKYILTGHANTMFANRISYSFDLRGPSLMVDTACSSSMIALYLAANLIRKGECDAAIVGGSSLCLHPYRFTQFNLLQMLSPDGSCKFFDASANGYARSEAISVMLIQKKSVAKRIYSSIVHINTNCDGYTSKGITFPCREVQVELMKNVYSQSKIDPTEVEYVEAHGTGTLVGDPEEVKAITEVFCANNKKVLLVGSVKSNMGHPEPAAGMCSLTKVILAMENGKIPPNLHYKNPNPNIEALFDGRIKVVDKVTPYNGGLIALNSFGFGGTNVHVLLKPYLLSNSKKSKGSFSQLVAVSGRTESAVKNLLIKIENSGDEELCALIRSIHQKNINNHFYRGYSILNGETSVRELAEYREEKRPVWFVFTGMGSHWPEMGKEMVKFEIFDKSLRYCSSVVEPLGLNVYDLVVNGTKESLNTMIKIISSIIAYQIALVDLLLSLNIRPDGYLGHSTGEISTAYADGALTAEQAMLCAYYRGKSFTEAKLPPGAMAAIGLSWSDAETRCPPGIYLACDNSADNVTISGTPEAMKEFLEKLQSEGVFAKEVDSLNAAYHCPYVVGSAPLLRTYLENVITNPRKRSSRWVSSSVEESKWSSELAQYCSIDYQVNNLVSPVLFRSALKHIPSNAVVIEIAPHSLLQAVLKRSLPSTCTNIGVVNKRQANIINHFLSSVGRMYNAGLQPRIDALYPEDKFPVSRGTPMISNMVEWDHSTSWTVKTFRETNESTAMYKHIVSIGDERDKFFAGHRIDGRVLFPATGYLMLPWKCLSNLLLIPIEELPVKIWNVRIHRATILTPDADVMFSVNVLRGNGQFEVCESGSLVASGMIIAIDDPESETVKLPPSDGESSAVTFTSDELYKELRLRGYEYSGLFKGVCSADDKGTRGLLNWENNWITFMDTMLQFTIIGNMTERSLQLPTEIERIIIDPEKHKHFKNGDCVSVEMNRNIGVVKSGGIEIRGLKTVMAPLRTNVHHAPTLEKYMFVPYNNGKSGRVESKDTNLSYRDLLTVNLQIVVENLFGITKIHVAEIAGSKPPEKLLAVEIVNILQDMPMIYASITEIVGKITEYCKDDRLVSIGADFIETHDMNESHFETKHLLVATNVLNRSLNGNSVFSIAKLLKHGTFILLEEECNVTVPQEELGLQTISIQVIGEKKIILLRKCTHPSKMNVVRLTEDNYSWMKDLKSALKESESDGSKVILMSHGEKQSGIIGMVNCIKDEPGGKNLRCFFIQDKTARNFSLSEPLYEDQIKKDIFMNVYANGVWGSYRHIALNDILTKPVKYAYINTLTVGDLTSLRWIEGPRRHNNNICYVYYAPLNFKDCLIATGRITANILPDDPVMRDFVLGCEFCGRDIKGQRVMGFSIPCGLSTTVIMDPLTTWEVPKNWTMEQAATVPIVYSTAYYALILRGKMKPGESILIHAGAGGVGLAAIHIALHMGVTVYTTVGSKEKRDFLKRRFPQLTDRHIANSRDNTFEKHILHVTEGRGVDLVLNSFAEEKLHASVRCLGKNGRFLEIGKFDILNNNPIGMSLFANNTSFHAVFLDNLLNENVKEKQDIARLVQEGLKSGVVQPLPTTVYNEDQAEEAFRFLASGKNIGKVMLKIREEENVPVTTASEKIISAVPRTYFNPNKVYIIVGGLGGMGLELVEWMRLRGAKNFVLTSRTGVKNGYQSICILRWQKLKIRVIVSTVDCTQEHEAVKLIEESEQYGPIGGIFNLAIVLKDALFENQTEDSFAACCAPKVNITKILDKISRDECPELDHFVVFSSVSCGRGNPGQSNYGFANSVMERICEARKSDGLPGLAIQWGMVGDVGLIADTMGNNYQEIRGVQPQKISSCFKALDTFLIQSNPVVSSIVLTDKMVSTKKSSSAMSIIDFVAKVVGISNIDNINESMTLTQIGMDSLMLTEIKQTFERSYNVIMSLDEIRNLTFPKLRNLSLQANTIPQLTSSPASQKKFGERPKHLLPIHEATEPIVKLPFSSAVDSNKPNVFIVHPIQGVVTMLENLASKLPANVWGLQFTRKSPSSSVPDLASHYVQHIRSIQKNGPYVISGYSFGVVVALEIGVQLEQSGESVSLLLLDGALHYIITIPVLQEKMKEVLAGQTEEYILRITPLILFAMFCGMTDLIQFLRHLIALQSHEERVSLTVKEVSPVVECTEEQARYSISVISNLLLMASNYTPKRKFSGDVTLVKSRIAADHVEDDTPYDLAEAFVRKITLFTITGFHEDITENEEVVKKIVLIFTSILQELKSD